MFRYKYSIYKVGTSERFNKGEGLGSEGARIEKQVIGKRQGIKNRSFIYKGSWRECGWEIDKGKRSA